MKISPLAGKPAPLGILVNVPRLLTAYYAGVPDPSVPEQRVAFGTSGHRGSSFKLSFNEWHILAITQAICLYRRRQKIAGPLYLGIDTHALSVPACATALEVLAANGVEVMLAEGDEYTPTPVISHAILTYNRGRKGGLADGIVITPCAESLASENASRLAAMQRADTNIDDLLETLHGTFHELRQSGIDEELFDVISGFEALSKGEAPQGAA
jgi:alpha-D-glucose phosphate-specific phosphoglucomutase